MSEDTFPARPRLGRHVVARKHLVDGAERFVLTDTRTGQLIQLGAREWGLIAAADGTRDVEGIVLAAAREGAHARPAALRGFLEQLHAAGLLDDGIEQTASDVAEPADRADLARHPLHALPDFSLHCDGRGSCCRLYASVIFSPVEAARARALLPLVLDAGARHERAFLPERGSAPTGGSAVALSDGRCIYLGDAGRCAIHAAGGAAAKPLGCNVFPASFVDDGARVRVSASVECACVIRSVGRPGGAPLIPPEIRVRGDLDETLVVEEIPAEIAVNARDRAPRDEIVALFDRLAQSPAPADAARAIWSLGEGLDAEGITPRAVDRFEHPDPIAPAGIAPFLEALHRRAEQRAREDAAWRSDRDLVRLASDWIERATRALLEPGAIAALLDAPPMAPAGEAFYVRAILHGCRLAGEIPISIAARDRAARIVVSRAMRAIVAEIDPGDPACEEPLALLEAMLRGHGLASYVHDVHGGEHR